MEIRNVKLEEYQFIDNFVYEIFKQTTFSNGVVEKALVKEIREKPYYIPELDLVVEDNGEIIGHLILSKFPISKQHENEVLLLSPVSVAIHKQGQGVGGLMIKEGIRLANQMGFKGIVVEGDYRYYSRFGFQTSTLFGLFASAKNLPPAPEYLMAMELQENGLKNITGEIDYSIYQALQH